MPEAFQQFIFKQPGDRIEGRLLDTRLSIRDRVPSVALVEHKGETFEVRLTNSLYNVVCKIQNGTRISILFTHEEANPNGTRQKRFTVETPRTSKTNPVYRLEKDLSLCPPQPHP